jgi:hypothetical protein
MEEPNPAFLLVVTAPLTRIVSGKSYWTTSTSTLGDLNRESFPKAYRWNDFELFTAIVRSKFVLLFVFFDAEGKDSPDR